MTAITNIIIVLMPAIIMAWADPLLLSQFVGVGGLLLIVAEGLGIAEEMV